MSTAGPRADFMTFSTANCCFNNVCWNTCARYAGRAHFVTYRLSWVCKEPLCFLGAVIWSPWLTRFKYGDRSPKHDKASRSITELNLYNNNQGDDGARALADAVKAILVRWF